MQAWIEITAGSINRVCVERKRKEATLVGSLMLVGCLDLAVNGGSDFRERGFLEKFAIFKDNL